MIRAVINLYVLLLIVNAVLSFFPELRFRPFVITIKKYADFTCAPIRKRLPPDLPFDFSPFIVILALKLIELLW